jgi:predicted aldo/keto reductase-like oxidoreductase
MKKKTEGVFSGNVTRREFIRASALGVVGMNMSWGGLSLGKQEGFAPLKRSRQGDMYYRQLGRTGLMVSEVSLGGSPVPPEDVFRQAIERGVNYADTSSNYMGGNSERQIGKAMKGGRDKFHVSTKIRPGRRRGFKDTKESLIREAEGSLRRLDTDYIDVLSCHGAPNPEILANEEVLAAFDQLKKDGKIRFTGVSCHRDPQWVLTDAIKSGNYDVISIAFNAYSDTQIEKDKVYDDYLERSGIETVINLAREHDVGIIAMKSMAGGERQNLTAFRTEGVSLPQAKLKWVLENENVTAVITEILSFDMLQEDLSVSTSSMSAEERKVLSDYVKATSRDYCRMCGTCLHHCPSDIAIPDIMRYALYYEGYGKQAIARRKYQSLSKESTILGCDFCRKCENACPYNLPIINKLHHAHRLLA